HLNNVDLNVTVETAKSNIHEKIDLKNVSETIYKHNIKLQEQRSNYEYASFEIEYLQPSRSSMDFSTNFKFLYKLDSRNSQDVFAQLTSNPNASDAHIAYQPFFFNSRSHVAVIYSHGERSSLQILEFTFNRKLPSQIHSEQFPSSKPFDEYFPYLKPSWPLFFCRSETFGLCIGQFYSRSFWKSKQL